MGVYSTHLEFQIEMLDLVSNTRETIATIDDDRSDFTPIMVDQFIYIFGGTNNYYPGALKGCSRYVELCFLFPFPSVMWSSYF